MVIKASIDIKESDIKIQKEILKALKPQVNEYFQKVFEKTKDDILKLVIEAIKVAPEYDSLVNGRLKAEFGLPDSQSRVDNIIDFWKNIDVQYKPVSIKSNELSASFVINMIKSDFSDVISDSSASFITEKGDELNWLEWLLLFGNKTIIKDYEVKLGPNPRSRTGMAVMQGVTRGKWRVPSEFSGTQNNNWITRAIDSVDSQINSLIQKNMRP